MNFSLKEQLALAELIKIDEFLQGSMDSIIRQIS